MGFSETKKETVVGAYHYDPANSWNAGRNDTGLGDSTVYLHPVLDSNTNPHG